MRTLATGELAAYLAEESCTFQVRVRRPGSATWVDLSATLGGDWVLGIDADADSPDQPAARFQIRLLKHAAEGSASPGIHASPLNVEDSVVRPLLHPGRSIEVWVGCGAFASRLWLQGEIEDAEWHGNEVLATCLSLDGVILAAQIEDNRDAPEGGVQSVIQWYLNTYLDGPAVTVLGIGLPDWTVPGHRTELGSLGEKIRELAQSSGWDIRYRWSDLDGAFRYTLYLPPRDKTVLDLSVPGDRVYGVAGLKQSRQHVRNVIHVDHSPDGSAWDRETVQDDASIEEYRRQALILREGDGSPIDSDLKANALAQFALSDLSQPLIDGRYRIPFIPWIEVHDLIEFSADGDHFDHDVAYAVVGARHRIDATETGTMVEVRDGAPVGAFFAWRRRRRTIDTADTGMVRIQSYFWRNPVTLSERFLDIAVRVQAGVRSLLISYGDVDDPSPEPTIDGTYTINVLGPDTIEHTLQVHGGGAEQVWPVNDPPAPPRPSVQVTVTAYSDVGGTGTVLGVDSVIARQEGGGGLIPASSGGTGRAGLTAGALVVGAGTDPVALLAPGGGGTFLRSDGSAAGWNAVGWSDIGSKPSEFSPSAHAASHRNTGGDPLTGSFTGITRVGELEDLAVGGPGAIAGNLGVGGAITEAGVAVAKVIVSTSAASGTAPHATFWARVNV